MEDSSENWLSHLEMDGGDSFNQCQTNSFVNIEDFCRDILQLPLPTISSKTESESHYLYPSSGIQNNSTATATAAVSSLSFEEICFNGQSSDNAVPDISPKQDYPSLKHSYEELGRSSPHLSSKRALGNHDFEPRAKRETKTRSSSEAQDHIMSERKRRQEMAEMFIALSTTIPGLKKINKASVLREAINYVKQLQERISVLEKETKKKSIKSLIIKKSHLCSASREANSNDYCGSNEVHPEVEARGLEKEVLIRIHCEKRKGIMLKLLALLENIHLSITSSSILQFGNSTLNITIIAQMGEEYNLTVNDLVRNLEQDLLKLFDMQI